MLEGPRGHVILVLQLRSATPSEVAFITRDGLIQVLTIGSKAANVEHLRLMSIAHSSKHRTVWQMQSKHYRYQLDWIPIII